MSNNERYFGSCPDCGPAETLNDAPRWPYLNIGRTHWFYCETHQTRWCVGENLFSSWRDEDEAVWHEDVHRVGFYREVGDAPQPRSQANVLVGRDNPRARPLVEMFDQLQTFQDAIDDAERSRLQCTSRREGSDF
jgi:hypothetical protein